MRCAEAGKSLRGKKPMRSVRRGGGGHRLPCTASRQSGNGKSVRGAQNVPSVHAPKSLQPVRGAEVLQPVRGANPLQSVCSAEPVRG